MASPDEIDALLGLRPLRDHVYGYLLERAAIGALPLYFAAIPRALIRPFDTEYDPSKHPIGEAAIEQTMADWRAGIFHYAWVYPSDDSYVLSDDYIPWAAAQRGQPDFLPCWVLGHPSAAGAVDIQGPIEPSRVRELLGLRDNEAATFGVSRDQARQIADSIIRARGLGTGVRGVFQLDEIHWQSPVMYKGPNLADCWIAYAERDTLRVGSSCVVLIAKANGEVLYAGDGGEE
jgi:hypothetical protein